VGGCCGQRWRWSLPTLSDSQPQQLHLCTTVPQGSPTAPTLLGVQGRGRYHGQPGRWVALWLACSCCAFFLWPCQRVPVLSTWLMTSTALRSRQCLQRGPVWVHFLLHRMSLKWGNHVWVASLCLFSSTIGTCGTPVAPYVLQTG
jgi:hypothetical protein